MSGEHGEPWIDCGWRITTKKDGNVGRLATIDAHDRAIACVNALDGVTTEAIEAGAVGELAKASLVASIHLWRICGLLGPECSSARVAERVDAALKPFEGMANVE